MQKSPAPLIIPFTCCLLLTMFEWARGQKEDPIPETSEIFRVSKVGARGAAESREQLMEFYQEIGKEYDAKVAQEAKTQKKAYRGKQVRILKVLSEKENGNLMYIAAYNGEPSVFVIAGDEKFKPGSLTPALKIAENGQHETSVTREVVERSKAAASTEPELEKTSSGGGVTFFGIPIDTGGGDATPPSAEAEETVTRKQVTEVRTMPKFSATISDEVSSEGPAKFSKDIFLDSLKNGEVFSVVRPENRRCKACRGFQRITTTMPVGMRDADGKMPCPVCNATGKKPWKVTYRIAW